jgi:NAD(P)H-dependent flavin oxidoreductase YrpB (nitropropane dioxygenase family)
MDMTIDASLSARLGIRDPILSAPMEVLAGTRLTAAASNAGGFGILGEAEQILLRPRNSSAALRSKEIHPNPLIT